MDDTKKHVYAKMDDAKKHVLLGLHFCRLPVNNKPLAFCLLGKYEDKINYKKRLSLKPK